MWYAFLARSTMLNRFLCSFNKTVAFSFGILRLSAVPAQAGTSNFTNSVVAFIEARISGMVRDSICRALSLWAIEYGVIRP